MVAPAFDVVLGLRVEAGPLDLPALALVVRVDVVRLDLLLRAELFPVLLVEEVRLHLAATVIDVHERSHFDLGMVLLEPHLEPQLPGVADLHHLDDREASPSRHSARPVETNRENLEPLDADPPADLDESFALGRLGKRNGRTIRENQRTAEPREILGRSEELLVVFADVGHAFHVPTVKQTALLLRRDPVPVDLVEHPPFFQLFDNLQLSP